jgi:nucleotide-binding universal stress UspA family protein
MSVVDTRRIDALIKECESAAHAVFERARLDQTEALQSTARSQMEQACLEAELDFDLRHVRGHLVDVLAREAGFHDLVVTGCPVPAGSEGWTLPGGVNRELTELVRRGVDPLLVVRGTERETGRVLVVHDGSPASSRAVKSFFRRNLYADAETRLLAWGKTERQARETLCDLACYARTFRTDFETGLTCEPLQRMLVPYAAKWEADLVVTGVVRRSRLINPFFRSVVAQLLKHTETALYLSG